MLREYIALRNVAEQEPDTTVALFLLAVEKVGRKS
jgi:hypothetical protein